MYPFCNNCRGNFTKLVPIINQTRAGIKRSRLKYGCDWKQFSLLIATPSKEKWSAAWNHSILWPGILICISRPEYQALGWSSVSFSSLEIWYRLISLPVSDTRDNLSRQYFTLFTHSVLRWRGEGWLPIIATWGNHLPLSTLGRNLI